MSWICKYFEHKPDEAATKYRERNGVAPYYEDYHYERYSTCLRCGEEISYVRFFNFWGTKARLVNNNLREWIE